MYSKEDFDRSALAKVIEDPNGTTEKLRFGHFEVLSELGRGAVGIVYKVLQTNLNRIVAIKVLEKNSLSQDDIIRFREEGKTIALLNHPNIVKVIDSVETEDAYFLCMEYIDGETLDKYLAVNELSWGQKTALLKNICEAIYHAHQKSIIHRDLKPSNIMIDRKHKCFVMDFGLAKILGKQNSLTRTGAVMGTPEYMSPEQSQGNEDIDHRTDIYSLGAVLYEVLTEQPPFSAATSLALIMKIVREFPMPPREINPEIPLALEQICLKCLEKNKDDRYQTAQEMAVDLEKYIKSQNNDFTSLNNPNTNNTTIRTTQVFHIKRKKRLRSTKKYRQSGVLEKKAFNQSQITDKRPTESQSEKALFSQSQLSDLNIKEMKRIRSSTTRRVQQKKQQQSFYLIAIFCLLVLAAITIIWSLNT